jgi:hypothetical protein
MKSHIRDCYKAFNRSKWSNQIWRKDDKINDEPAPKLLRRLKKEEPQRQDPGHFSFIDRERRRLQHLEDESKVKLKVQQPRMRQEKVEAREEEADRLAREEEARQEEADRLAIEEARQEEADRLAREEARQVEADRLAREEARQEEAKRLAREEEAKRQKLAREKREAEQEARIKQAADDRKKALAAKAAEAKKATETKKATEARPVKKANASIAQKAPNSDDVLLEQAIAKTKLEKIKLAIDTVRAEETKMQDAMKTVDIMLQNLKQEDEENLAKIDISRNDATALLNSLIVILHNSIDNYNNTKLFLDINKDIPDEYKEEAYNVLNKFYERLDLQKRMYGEIKRLKDIVSALIEKDTILSTNTEKMDDTMRRHLIGAYTGCIKAYQHNKAHLQTMETLTEKDKEIVTELFLKIIQRNKINIETRVANLVKLEVEHIRDFYRNTEIDNESDEVIIENLRFLDLNYTQEKASKLVRTIRNINKGKITTRDILIYFDKQNAASTSKQENKYST